MKQNYSYKLTPIELSVMREIENSPRGLRPEDLRERIGYTSQDKFNTWPETILRRLQRNGLVFEVSGIYFKSVLHNHLKRSFENLK